MNNLSDFHIHSTFSDGKNIPEDIVKSAIDRGFYAIGFSDHCYTDFDESYCIKKDKITEYVNEINRLREKYADRIKILCGIEQDFFSDSSTEPYDYVIGSLHYVKCGDEYIPVDESAETQINAVGKYFGGDPMRFCEEYFRTVAGVAEKTQCDIIGHFDLVSKYSEKCDLVDVTSKRYIKAATDAADALLAANKPFEINTGAISRGYRTTPYPSRLLADYIAARGGRFVLSSDSHRAESIGYKFEAYKSYTDTIIEFLKG